MKHDVWIKKYGCRNEESFRLEVEEDATVSDLIRDGYKIFYPSEGGPILVSELELLQSNQVLSNQARLSTLDVKAMFELRLKYSSFPRSIDELKHYHSPGGKEIMNEAAATTTTTSVRATSPNASRMLHHQQQGPKLTPRPETKIERPGKGHISPTGFPRPEKLIENCIFSPRWDTKICEKCGFHSRLHAHHPVPIDVVREEIVKKFRTHSPDVSSRVMNFTKKQNNTSNSGSKNSKNRKSSAGKELHQHETLVCSDYTPQWGRRQFCFHCGHHIRDHPNVKMYNSSSNNNNNNGRRPNTSSSTTYSSFLATIEKIPYSPSPTPRGVSPAGKTHEATSNSINDYEQTLPPHPRPHFLKARVPREKRGICAEFIPLWDNNDVCWHCYHLEEEHVNPLVEARQARMQIFEEKRIKKRSALILCALPWHIILSFCSVEDLFSAGKVCRLLTMSSRPLLHATLTQVLNFELPEEKENLRRHAIHVAENLAPYSDAAREFARLCVHLVQQPDESELESMSRKLDNFSFRIDLVKQVACVHPMTIDKTIGRRIVDLEAFQLPSDHELFPLLEFFRSLWLQHTVRSRAAGYLSHDKVFL